MSEDTAAGPHPQRPGPALLEVRDAWLRLGRGRGSTQALAGLQLRVEPGRHLGVVGVSGVGKSTLARAVVGLTQLASGSIEVDGRPVRAGRPEGLRWLRARVQLVAQDASGSLNPRHTAQRIVSEPIECLGLEDDPAYRAAELCELVRLPRSVLGARPGELSGGQQQRLAIARALAARPRLLLGDEMFSALDPVTKVELAELLEGVAAAEGLTMMLVSHDLDCVHRLCDDVVVIDAGRVVESGPVSRVFDAPVHAVTRSLLGHDLTGEEMR